MEKIFTKQDIIDDVNKIIDQYVGETDEDTEVTRAVLHFTFNFPGLIDLVCENMLGIFMHPETAENEINAFKWGISQTCSNQQMIDACTAVYCELVSDFCDV